MTARMTSPTRSARICGVRFLRIRPLPALARCRRTRGATCIRGGRPVRVLRRCRRTPGGSTAPRGRWGGGGGGFGPGGPGRAGRRGALKRRMVWRAPRGASGQTGGARPRIRREGSVGAVGDRQDVEGDDRGE